MMAGFDKDRAGEVLAAPDAHHPVTATAVGWMADVDELPRDLREREAAPRSRKPVE